MLAVLIVEDEADIRDMAAIALDAAGYQIFTADGAEPALAILRDHPDIDLLVADTRLAGAASGFGLARAAERLRPEIKVLYTTARPDELLRLDSPIDPMQVLRKPYQAAELQRMVGWLLQAAQDAGGT